MSEDLVFQIEHVVPGRTLETAKGMLPADEALSHVLSIALQQRYLCLKTCRVNSLRRDMPASLGSSEDDLLQSR